jgi:hypothetical protein
MHSMHFEPVEDYRHEGERPIAWLARCYKAENAEEAYRHKMDYENAVMLHRKCLNIAEAKGLVGTPDLAQFKTLMRALPQIGIEILEINRHGKIHIYETKDFCGH